MKKTLLFILLFFPFLLQAQITLRACDGVLGTQDYILTATGTTNDGGTIRNTYESTPLFAPTQTCPAGVCEVRIIWSIANGQWEIQLDNDGPLPTPDWNTAVLYTNSTPSEPDPPDLTLGLWVDNLGGGCGGDGSFTTLTGNLQSTVSGGTVPIELSYFEAKKQAHQIILKWQTATEYNNDYFLIEHSMDGQYFSTISKVKGQGFSNENQNYQYTSNIVQDGVNYYRLQQVDFDNSRTFSQTIAIDYQQKEIAVQLFPLPVSEKLNIVIPLNTEKEDIAFQIFDAMGQTIQNSSITLKGNNSQLDLSSLPKGFYYIKFKVGKEEFTKKFSKL